MLTARARWLLLLVLMMLLYGILRHLLPLVLVGLTLLLWLGGEWLLFAVRVRTALRRLRVEREVWDEHGPAATLWSGRDFTVRVRLRLRGRGRLPHVSVADRVPFGVEHVGGATTKDGELRARGPLELVYQIRCGGAGAARFEGLRVQVADLQGFFYHALFVRAPVVLRVLPRLVDPGHPSPSLKRENQLLPPGIHRLHRPGSGSELLDLRDYLPGDPPKTIAWKVSARRDRLITKEFESEVPVRCTLFVDTSNSVRVLGGDAGSKGRSLDRLIEIAAGALRANGAVRDLTGLCLFDERGVRVVRPDRRGSHQTHLLRLLAEAATEAPAVGRVDPDGLLPLAHAFAQEVYSDLLRPDVNAVPFWLPWFLAFPGFTRRRRTLREALYRHKRLLLFLSSSAASLAYLLFPLTAALVGSTVFLAGEWLQSLDLPPPLALLLTGLLGVLLPAALPVSLYLGVLLANRRRQRLAVWRKRLAALLSVRYGLAPGGLEALLEDDDQLALLLQRFLAEHRVPYAVPLYDSQGHYLFAAPEKVPVLANALLQAVGKGHDNELFVLLADVLELDEHLDPLLRAVAVALSRHHQVLLICPWPPGLPPPGSGKGDKETRGQGDKERERPSASPCPLVPVSPCPGDGEPEALVGRATCARFRAAYQRLRRRFARLGVPVVCAAGDEPVPLILARLERLRNPGRAR